MKKLKPIVSVLLLAWLAWRTNWEQVGHAFSELRPELWLAACGVYALTQVLSALRWQMMSRPLGFNQPYRHFFGLYFIGMFFNLLLPTAVGGDVVRAWYLNDNSGRKLPAFVSVFVERASGLMVLLLLALVGSLFCPPDVPPWVCESVWITVGLAIAGGVGILVLNAFVRLPESETASTGQADAPSKRFVLKSAIGLFQSALLDRPALLVTTTLLSIGVQALNVVVVWILAQAIGIQVPGSYWWMVVPMVSLLTVIVPSINGTGVREGGMVLFLVKPMGVAHGAAFSLGIIWFSVMAALSLVGGCVYLFGRFSRPEVQSDDEPVRHRAYQGRTRQSEAIARSAA